MDPSFTLLNNSVSDLDCSPEEPVESHNKPSEEWAGRGSIGQVSTKAIKRFLNLPPEVHHRLQLACAQLTAERLALNERLSSTQQLINPRSAAQQYELARFALDNAPDPAPIPKPVVQEKPRLLLPTGYTKRNAYLRYITAGISTWAISRGKLEQKEELRIALSRLVLDAVIEKLKLQSFDAQIGPISVILQCFGSYRTGFALPDSDMDLVLVSENLPLDIQRDLPLLTAQCLSSKGFAPYLFPSLEDGCSPILRVCHKPSKRFRDILEWECPDLETASELRAFTSTPLACCYADKPISHYNIYFSEPGPILRRSDLLRGYRICDDRVYEMALVVKRWAKARKINDPYNGTLSSYGYTLMLLHYLMNIVSPPVIPNLHIYKTKALSTNKSQSAQERDDYFWRNPKEIAKEAARGRLTKNSLSSASLLAGFFEYYSRHHRLEEGVPHEKSWKPKFDWFNGVVSVREPHVTKRSKLWTTWRIDERGNQRRYVLAIEDPIDTRHNVADMVTVLGVTLIREEFTRAHYNIVRARPVPGTDLAWQTESGEFCEDLFAERPTPFV